MCTAATTALSPEEDAEEKGKFTRLRENDSVLGVAFCTWGYSLAPEHKHAHLQLCVPVDSQQETVGQGLIAAGLLLHRWNVCPPSSSLQITVQESCCAKQNLKHNLCLFPGKTAQSEAVG